MDSDFQEAGFCRRLDFRGWIFWRLDFLGEGWIYGPGFCWELDFLTEGWIFEAGFFGGWIFKLRAGFSRLDFLEAGFLT